MKKRYRFGFEVKLPFGLFPNAAIVVLHLNAQNAERIISAVQALQAALSLSNYADIAGRIVCEEA